MDPCAPRGQEGGREDGGGRRREKWANSSVPLLPAAPAGSEQPCSIAPLRGFLPGLDLLVYPGMGAILIYFVPVV